jgi:hypothetical protein
MITILCLSFSCEQNSSGIALKIDFINGEEFDYTKAYVIWLENSSDGSIQNLFVCNRVNLQDLADTALPYWEMNKRILSDEDEIDAVSGATQKKCDFTINSYLKSDETEFTIYFEVDHSFDPNDWFTDQPALLYSAHIDLSNPENSYELNFIGWTPNSSTENIITNTPAGVLQHETRYITEGNPFGTVDDRKATDMIGSIRLTIER